MRLLQIMELIIIFVVVVMALLIILSKGKKTADRVASILSIPAFFGGMTVYLLCYLPVSGKLSEVIVGLFRAIFSSGKMFLLNDDFAVISAMPQNQALVSSEWFLVLFWMFHVMALTVSALVILSVVGSRIIDGVRRHSTWGKDIYIICGVNDVSLCFAENIISQKGRFVVFIDEECNKSNCDRLRDLGCALIDAPFAPSNRQTGELFRKAGIKSSNSNKHIYFFAFTDDYVNNGNLILVALNTAEEEKLSESCFKAYAVLEDGIVPQSIGEMNEALEMSYDVQFFNECDLSARQLVNIAAPCEIMEFDHKTGLPKAGYERFKVVIVGFGPLGQQVLKKLLCNAQFEGCTFEAVLIDRSIHNITGQFKNRYPGIFAKYNLVAEECEVFSEKFYEVLGEQALDARYVVVALGDDNTNLEAAVDIDRILTKRGFALGKQGSKRIIAVNVRNREHVFEGKLSELQSKYTLFGQYESILTEEVIIHASMDAMAEAFHDDYSAHITPPTTPWEKLSLFNRQSNRAVAAFVPAFLKMMGLKLADANDEQTNTVTSDEYEKYLNANPVLVENLSRTEHMRWNAFHFSEGWELLPVGEIAFLGNHKDNIRKLHACLVDWEELKGVSREVSRITGENKDFQVYDIDNVLAIPAVIKRLPNKVLVNKQGV